MLREEIICHLSRRSSLRIDPFLKQLIYLFLMLEMLPVRVSSGKRKPFWYFKKREFNKWDWFQKSKRAGTAKEKRILITGQKVPYPWARAHKSVPAAVQLELLSQSVLDLPSRCHFYQKWKVQRIERLLVSTLAATIPTASNYCISPAQSRKPLFLFLISYQCLLLIESNRKPAARKEAWEISLAEFQFH